MNGLTCEKTVPPDCCWVCRCCFVFSWTFDQIQLKSCSISMSMIDLLSSSNPVLSVWVPFRSLRLRVEKLIGSHFDSPLRRIWNISSNTRAFPPVESYSVTMTQWDDRDQNSVLIKSLPSCRMSQLIANVVHLCSSNREQRECWERHLIREERECTVNGERNEWGEKAVEKMMKWRCSLALASRDVGTTK